jgi:hypothetical protein
MYTSTKNNNSYNTDPTGFSGACEGTTYEEYDNFDYHLDYEGDHSEARCWDQILEEYLVAYAEDVREDRDSALSYEAKDSALAYELKQTLKSVLKDLEEISEPVAIVPTVCVIIKPDIVSNSEDWLEQSDWTSAQPVADKSLVELLIEEARNEMYDEEDATGKVDKKSTLPRRQRFVASRNVTKEWHQDAIDQKNSIWTKVQKPKKRVVSHNARDKAYLQVSDKKHMLTHLKKTQMCKHFLKRGRCPFGKKCNFAHKKSELSTPICKFGMGCRKKTCQFKHPSGWTPATCVRPCRFGEKCNRQSTCKFTHPTPPEPKSVEKPVVIQIVIAETKTVTRKCDSWGTGLSMWAQVVKGKIPETKMEIPETKMEIPETKMEIPETKMEIPETKMEIPETKMETKMEETVYSTMAEKRKAKRDRKRAKMLANRPKKEKRAAPIIPQKQVEVEPESESDSEDDYLQRMVGLVKQRKRVNIPNPVAMNIPIIYY